mmetsp:Transcript_35460/g.59541  ORF Transcript_35460/g.59541 Transcript_35460/m.59541 type:complete len:82 (-) Transcript_35460:860-1105(-)
MTTSTGVVINPVVTPEQAPQIIDLANLDKPQLARAEPSKISYASYTPNFKAPYGMALTKMMLQTAKRISKAPREQKIRCIA